MSNRLIRINELVQREISAYLRKRYQTESACITISGVEITPDLKEGKVYISVIGPEEQGQARLKWLQKISPEIRHVVGQQVVMKWTPQLTFILDVTPHRAARILGLMDEIEAADRKKAQEQQPPSS
jgi:ribosome-binding factor A